MAPATAAATTTEEKNKTKAFNGYVGTSEDCGKTTRSGHGGVQGGEGVM